jgi:hypothetical protein
VRRWEVRPAYWNYLGGEPEPVVELGPMPRVQALLLADGVRMPAGLGRRLIGRDGRGLEVETIREPFGPEQRGRRDPARGLHFRRTRYSPGFGVCSCEVCHREWWRFQNDDEAQAPARGTLIEGCLYVNREKVFAEAWAHENRGEKVSQELMRRPPRPGEKAFDFSWAQPVRVAFWIGKKERTIIATIVQWLGSNVGFDFLTRCLQACGYDVVKKGAADGPFPVPLEQWHEDLGPALWWKFPIEEPPYCGTPLDDDWPGYHTHWTPVALPRDYWRYQ